MYSNPYKGIFPAVQKTLDELVPADDTYHRKHLRRFARTLHIFLEQEPTGRLLEIGTSGVMAAALSRLAPDLEIEVTNYDPDEDRIHEFHAYGHTFRSYFADLEYHEMPVDDGYFDWILCCEVLEHMEIDPMFMLEEVNRITKLGGHMLLTTPNVVSTRGLTKMVSGIEPHFYMQYNKDRSYNRHNYEYSARSLATLLHAAGFSGKVWTEDTFEDPMPAVLDRLNAAGFNIHNTGDNILSVSEKIGPIVNRYPEFLYAADE